MRPRSGDGRRRAELRAVSVAQCLVGAPLLLRPGPVATAVAGSGTPAPRAVVRLLGARIVAQGLAQLARPDVVTPTLGAAVDGTHAASMVALAAISPRFRRSALTSAAVATLSAGSCLLLARRAPSS